MILLKIHLYVVIPLVMMSVILILNHKKLKLNKSSVFYGTAAVIIIVSVLVVYIIFTVV